MAMIGAGSTRAAGGLGLRAARGATEADRERDRGRERRDAGKPPLLPLRAAQHRGRPRLLQRRRRRHHRPWPRRHHRGRGCRAGQRRAQPRERRGGRGRPIRGPLGQQRADEAIERARQPRRQCRHLGVEVLRQHLDQGVAQKRRTAGEHLEQHRTDRVEIGARVDHRTLGLLGRHVPRRAEQRAHAREPLRPRARLLLAHQPEVEQLERLAAVRTAHQQDVLGLDVAVDEAVAVHVGQRLAAGSRAKARRGAMPASMAARSDSPHSSGITKKRSPPGLVPAPSTRTEWG
ncbi:MAG: hypothetical protein U0168_21625 [Nannocystaceae bacterium]